MAIKKSELYSSLWKSCDELRGENFWGQALKCDTSYPEFVLICNVEFRTILPRDVLTMSLMESLGLKDRQMKAVSFVKEHLQITNKQYVDTVAIFPMQAVTDLRELV